MDSSFAANPLPTTSACIPPSRRRRHPHGWLTVRLAEAVAATMVAVPVASAVRSAVDVTSAQLRRRPRSSVSAAFVGSFEAALGGTGSVSSSNALHLLLAPTRTRPRRRCAAPCGYRFCSASRDDYDASERDDPDDWGGKGGARLSDFEAEFFDSVDKEEAPRDPKTAGAVRPRARLSDFESDFFDFVESPDTNRRSSVGHAALGASGGGGGVGGPMASGSSSARAVRPAAASSSSVLPPGQPRTTNFRPQREITRHERSQNDPRQMAQPQPVTPHERRQLVATGALAGGGAQRVRPMPPPVSEYDYDYYDEELGVSASFGENYGQGNGALTAPAARSASAASPRQNMPLSSPRKVAAVAARASDFWDEIEGVEDPDYDPFFTVDADADVTSKLPETELDAHWAGEDDESSLMIDSDSSYGLLGDDPGATEGGRKNMRRFESPSNGVMPEEDSTFRSAEDFLRNEEAPGTSRSSATRILGASPLVAGQSANSSGKDFDVKSEAIVDKPRYDDAASVFGVSSNEPRKEQMPNGEVEETEEVPTTSGTKEHSRHNEIEDVLGSEQRPWPSRFSEIEDIVSDSSRPSGASQGYDPYEQSPPARLRETAVVLPDTSKFLATSSSGSGAASSISVLSARLDQIKVDVFAANGGKEFNPNSPKQVAEVLYGKDGAAEGQSTDRDSLEALASTGNTVADLVLKYRRCLRELRREEKRAENRANGNHVTSVGDMHIKRQGAGDNGATAVKQSSEYQKAKEDPFNSDSLESDPLLLLDASAYIFRAYYSMPPLHRSDGTPVGAVLGFCNMLNRLVLGRMLSGLRPRLALVFDAPGRTFRHDMYAEYKANRKSCPMDLVPQFDIIREAADAYGIPQVEAAGYEADDLIATLARIAIEEGVDVNILSGDKDLMQLVTPLDETPGIHMIDPMNMVHITYDTVMEKWGVPPGKVGDVLALAGDSSDNIPGVPGVGPKIAATLINDFGSLEEVLTGAENIKQKGRREKVMENTDKARLSRSLVELDQSVPLEKTTVPENFACIGDIRMDPMSVVKLLDFYDRMGFNDLKRRFKARLHSSSIGGMAASQLKLPEEEISYQFEDGNESSRTRERLVAGEKEDSVITGNGQNGLFVHQRNWSSPPKPEDYSDVPF